METRKLIKFGNSSHVVSLPTSWLKKHSLNKGDSVFMKENEHDLILSYETKEYVREPTAIVINCDSKSNEILAREILSAYFNHFNTISLVGKEIPKKAKDVSTIIHNLVALEIVEQTSTKIIAKDFLKLEEVSIPEIARKADITTRSMLEDARLTIGKNNYKALIDKDQSVNKLCFLLFKVIRTVIKDPSIAKSFKLDGIELFDYWLLTDNLEHLADETKRVARFVSKMNLSEEAKKDLRKIFMDIEDSYLEVMKAFYQKDRELAYDVSSKKTIIIKECDTFLEKHSGPLVGNLVEKLKSMNNSVKKISRIVYTQ